MHYNINNLIYKSESAARSNQQRQIDLVKIISKIEKVDIALDYGCGKLRYNEDLKNISNSLFLTDSETQLTKKQTIFGEKQTIHEFCSRQKNSKVLSLEKLHELNGKVDFILLSNVLSSIPIESSRVEILQNIELLLKPTGKALIVVQYKDSYFKTYPQKEGVKMVNNGYLFESRGQVRYYAILNKLEIEKLISKTDLVIENVIDKKGRLFVFIQKNVC